MALAEQLLEEISLLGERIDALEEENERLRDALYFYAVAWKDDTPIGRIRADAVFRRIPTDALYENKGILPLLVGARPDP